MSLIIQQTVGWDWVKNGGRYVIESDKMGGANPPYMPTVPNLSCVMEVYEEIGANFELLTRSQGRYSNANKQCPFNISNLIKFNTEEALPEHLNQTYGTINNALVKKIQCRFADRYDIPPETDEFQSATEEILIHGGAEKTLSLTSQTINPDLFVAHNYANYGVKTMARNQPEWIYIFALGDQGMTDIPKTIKIYFDDGFIREFPDVAIPVESNKFTYFSAGWAQQEYDALIAAESILANPIGWEVIINNQVTIKFKLDAIDRDYGEFIIHTNQLGGLETYWLKGKGTYGFESSSEEIRQARRLPIGSLITNTKSGDFKTINKLLRDEIKINSGIQDRYAINLIRQLYLGDCWLIRENFLKVNLQPGKQDIYEDDQDVGDNVELVLRLANYKEIYNRL